jgi:hypothetical protein
VEPSHPISHGSLVVTDDDEYNDDVDGAVVADDDDHVADEDAHAMATR